VGCVPGAAGPGTHEPGGVDLKSSLPALKALVAASQRLLLRGMAIPGTS